LGETVLQRVVRKLVIVLLACEPLFLSRRDDLAVHHQRGGRVVIERRNSENGSHASVSVRAVSSRPGARLHERFRHVHGARCTSDRSAKASSTGAAPLPGPLSMFSTAHAVANVAIVAIDSPDTLLRSKFLRIAGPEAIQGISWLSGSSGGCSRP